MANGGRLNFVPTFLQFIFRCKLTVSRGDGSQYNTRKTFNLYRSKVQRICDGQIKKGKPEPRLCLNI